MCRWAQTVLNYSAGDSNVSHFIVIITATIDDFEERDVAIFDVPDAFLRVDMDEEVIITIQGRLTELMVKASPRRKSSVAMRVRA
jgi:hypothetical protein